MRFALVVAGLTLVASSQVAAQEHYRLQTAAGAVIGAGAGYLTEQERQRQAAAQQKAFEAGVQARKQQSQKN